MKYKNISKEQLQEQAEGYVRAIQWNLHYYYHGCCSWNWCGFFSNVISFNSESVCIFFFNALYYFNLGFTLTIMHHTYQMFLTFPI